MKLLKNDSNDLDQIILKAREVFLENPTNQKAKNLLIEAFSKKLIKEESESFDLFAGLEKKTAIDDLKSSEILEKSIVDPTFGLKAALCFGELPLLQLEILDFVESYGIDEELAKLLNFSENFQVYLREKGQIDTETPGSDRKIGGKRVKYAGGLKDLSKATKTGQGKEEILPVTIGLSPQDKDMINKEISRVWIPFNRSKMGYAISTNNMKGTVTPTGAGEIEFLARMLYASTKNLDHSIEISSSIQLSNGSDRSLVEEQEAFLLNLGEGKFKNKIAVRCRAILEVYMVLACEKILKPILKNENDSRYLAEKGIEKAIDKLLGIEQSSDEISEGKYDFSRANFAAWSYTVARNYVIDQIKNRTNYEFDNSKAFEFAYGLKYPFEVISKVDPKVAKGQFVRPNETNKIKIERENKSTGKPYFVYTYDDANKFLEDLQIANGFTREMASDDEETRTGPKLIYQTNNPLYYKNVSDSIRSFYMSSVPKYLPSQEPPLETPSDLERKYILTKIEKENTKLLVKKIINNTKDELLNISKDIVKNVLMDAKEKKDSYGQNKVKSFVKDNQDLASLIIFRLFGYGIYKFVENESIKQKREREKEEKNLNKPISPEGSYEWITKTPSKYPSFQEYFNDFINSIQTSSFSGQGLPQTVKNKLGSEMPITEFVKLLRKIVLGSGMEGKELEKYFKAGKENTEEFKSLVKSKGFLIQNPSYLRKIYSLLQKLPKGEELGSTPQPRLDEQIKILRNSIKEIKNELEIFNRNLIKNILINR